MICNFLHPSTALTTLNSNPTMPPRQEGVDPKNIVHAKRRPRPPKVFGANAVDSPKPPPSDQGPPQRRTPGDTPSPVLSVASLVVGGQGSMEPAVKVEGPEVVATLPCAPAITSILSQPAPGSPIALPDGRSTAHQPTNAPEINFEHWSESALERSVPTTRGMTTTLSRARRLMLIGSVLDGRGPHSN